MSHPFGHRLRVRISGLCEIDGKFLLLCHHGGIQTTPFWAPPGGGLDFGETVYEALKREFIEETGLVVEIEDFLFVNEFLAPPLHAIELFFKVRPISLETKLGSDPELETHQQILSDLQWLSFEEIKALPSAEVHAIFHLCETKADLYRKKGFIDHLTALNGFSFD